MKYPPAPRTPLVETLHGVPVADPFRPLEQADDPATAAWVDAENALTRRELDTPTRERLLARLRELHRVPRASVPAVRGSRVFYTFNDGMLNQPVLKVNDRVLLDPNEMDAAGTTAVTAFEPDDTGARVVYALSQRGSDVQELKVRDVETGADLDDVIQWVKFASIAWRGDGFFYTRFPAPGTVPPEHEQYFCQVWFHPLGRAQSDDTLIYHRPDVPEAVFEADVTSDGRYLVITSRRGASDDAEVHVIGLGRSEHRPLQDGDPLGRSEDRPLPYGVLQDAEPFGRVGDGLQTVPKRDGEPPGRVVPSPVGDGLQTVPLQTVPKRDGEPPGRVVPGPVGDGLQTVPHRDDVRPLVTGFTAGWHFVDGEDDHLYFHTDAGAPFGHVVRIDLADEMPKPHVVVPESQDKIADVAVADGRLLVSSLRNASSRLESWSLDGRDRREIELPGIGSIVGLAARWRDPQSFVTFTSFPMPPAVMAVNTAAGRVERFGLMGNLVLPFDPADYVIEQVWYPSKDGTPISMFLVSRRATLGRYVLLSGYGGFNISVTPAFDASDFLWLDAGGTLAVANLRGGGEYGDAWHRAGMRERKQTVFDDFIAAAEWLRGSGRAAPGQIAIEGGSNGGLLVAAAMV
jgi:prolyl oligopeptidase PreP (S9A serine peptidase family)